MSEVKGKFITLTGSLMALYPKQRTEADTTFYLNR
jgi:hypothetical protein